MNIKDEVYPKVKADFRMADDKTLWVKVSKPEFEKIDRIILEDGNIFCKVFYQDAEPDYTEMKQEFLQMASFVDVILECSDEQKEILLGFVSRLSEYMPWNERD